MFNFDLFLCFHIHILLIVVVFKNIDIFDVLLCQKKAKQAFTCFAKINQLLSSATTSSSQISYAA